MSLDFLSKDFNWGGGGGSSSLGKICFLQIVKPGKFGEEEKQAVLLKKKKKKKKGLLELAFLEKNKTKQNPTFFHEAFFFQKYLPSSIFSYLPMLIFQNKHLSLSALECEEVPLRLCPASQPGSNCHLLPMAQQMTKSTAGPRSLAR